ncbi:Aminoglycoside phosphotransferase [Cordyceps javanica]|uniref:Aminoglycoside phosphotransferase n=1 Tax=Cordyceps javanica TaxID=43265 RepID=A0A545VY78_9HYPO|nr:Aminoglycoside phosphotransferase [Cordyceps javanica]TQW06669.1 Aminoglycoside phosphotransferase [Cordyceps javanica]
MPLGRASGVLKSISDAIESEENELVAMRNPKLKEQVFDSITASKGELEALICQLLQVKHCRITPSEIWEHGSSNVAIKFTHPDNTPWWRRRWRRFNSIYAFLLGRPGPITHVRQSIRHNLASGFLLISCAHGERLDVSWRDHCHDRSHRANLFRGLARIAVSMNAVPQPRLGSFSLQPDDTIALSNRPLNMYMHMAENEGVPLGMPRQQTYGEVDSYIADLLSLQDSKLRSQPNAIFDVEDGQRQMAASAGMRAVAHHFTRNMSRRGPFYFTLNDLSQQNIFVDEDWNIETIIDLEWAHTLPIEMKTPPFWLTSRSVDGFMDPVHRKEYEEVLEEYLAIYEEEEEKRRGGSAREETTTQRRVWQDGSFWFYKAVVIPKAKYNLFNWHIQPMFNEAHPDMSIFDEIVHFYWGADASGVIDAKIEERKAYIEDVKKIHGSILGEGGK